MRRLIVFLTSGFLAMACAGTWTAAFADEARADPSCDLRGSWIGTIPGGVGKLIVTYDGATPNGGGDDVEFIDVPPWLLVPDAASVTSMRGLWQRIGKSEFAFTLIMYGRAADGTSVGSVKTFGVKTLSDGCNVMKVTDGAKFYTADEDPTNPEHGVLVAPHDPTEEPVVATRIMLDPDIVR